MHATTEHLERMEREERKVSMKRIEKFACLERLPNGDGWRVIPKKKMKHGTPYVGFDKKASRQIMLVICVLAGVAIGSSKHSLINVAS